MRNVILSLTVLFLGACAAAGDSANQNGTTKNLPEMGPADARVRKISNENTRLIPLEKNKPANPIQQSTPKIIKRDTTDNPGRFAQRKAPDDSVFTSRLDAGGYTGTRTFRNHPELKKIEKNQKGKLTRIRVYLNNGKVYDVTEEEIPNFRVASPVQILEAIGVRGRKDPEPASPTEKKEVPKNRKR